MRLLEIAKGDEDVVSITENLEIKFKDNRVYQIHGNRFKLVGDLDEPSIDDENEGIVQDEIGPVS